MMKYCRKQSKTVARKPTKKRQLSLKLSAAILFFLCVCSRLSSASFVYLFSALGGQRRFAIYRMRICERSMYGFFFVCQRSRLAVKSSSARSRKKEKEKKSTSDQLPLANLLLTQSERENAKLGTTPTPHNATTTKLLGVGECHRAASATPARYKKKRFMFVDTEI